MHSQANSEEDRALDVAPAVTPAAPWRVASLEVLPDYCLRVRFNDDTEGVVNLRQLIHAKDAGVFAALRDPWIFEQARVELGAVTWPSGQDLAPDAMHAAIRETGEWTPV